MTFPCLYWCQSQSIKSLVKVGKTKNPELRIKCHAQWVPNAIVRIYPVTCHSQRETELLRELRSRRWLLDKTHERLSESLTDDQHDEIQGMMLKFTLEDTGNMRIIECTMKNLSEAISVFKQRSNLDRISNCQDLALTQCSLFDKDIRSLLLDESIKEKKDKARTLLAQMLTQQEAHCNRDGAWINYPITEMEYPILHDEQYPEDGRCPGVPQIEGVNNWIPTREFCESKGHKVIIVADVVVPYKGQITEAWILCPDAPERNILKKIREQLRYVGVIGFEEVIRLSSIDQLHQIRYDIEHFM